ncbi:MAG: hypothetical protein SXQ77_04875 [Halobacteria archaeon]|nr:hypothetical protein [Halobacteria archaeon]
MVRKYSVIATILLILATVFYTTLQFFKTSEVIVRSGSDLEVSPGVLGIKIAALVAFLVVSIIGLYVCLWLLTGSHFEKESRGDEYVPWNLYIHSLRSSSNTEEDEED